MKAIRLIYLSIAVAVLGLFSCSSDDEQIDDLEEQFNALVALSESVTCDDIDEWRVAGIGAKACGGPTGHIAYSIRIDTVDFLSRLEQYNEAVRAKNEREDLFSDCMVISPPMAVQCENGKAILVYNPCDLEPDSGPCEAAIPRYYFDKETQECREFIWGGCQGTVPFDTMEDCRECERG